MKKLMIAACAIALAGVAQAYSVSWNSGNLYFAGADKANDGTAGGSKVADNTVTMYVFSHLSEDDYTTFAGLANLEALALFTEAGADSTLKIGETTYTLSDTGFTFGKSLDGKVTVGQETGYKNKEYAYGAAILLYDENLDGTADYVAIGEATGKVGTSGKNLDGIGIMRDDGSAATWSAVAVPEPTSGLLLLLGVAGLALRRRRA